LNFILFYESESPSATENEYGSSEIYFGDRAELAKSDLFEQSNLIFNNLYGFLICNIDNCNVILTQKWREHLRKKHQLHKKDIQNIQIDDLLQDGDKSPTDGIPIQGLKIREGIQCLNCHGIYETKNAFQNHRSQMHPKEICDSIVINFQQLQNYKRIIVNFLFFFFFFFFFFF